MGEKKNILILGTGTIGLPLVSLFTKYKKEFGISKVYFHKNTPLVHDMPSVKRLVAQGSTLVADTEKIPRFKELGVYPVLNREEAIAESDVIIDCTPVGLKSKPLYEKYSGKGKLFLAQGSEFGFGTIYARGINDEALHSNDEFIQIASCNTHNIAALLKTFEKCLGKVEGSRFVCIRRSNDVSQNNGITPAIEVGSHDEEKFGTHHSRDVNALFKTINRDMPVYSSACKINTQYMHVVHFSIKINCPAFGDYEINNQISSVVDCLANNRKIALTEHKTSNKVFSFGREFGHNGRILNQTVVSIPSLQVRKSGHGNSIYEITGFCFTPQDSNSLLSSISATLWHLHNKNWVKVDKLMDTLRPYLFQKI